jgi:hypothetical protein
MLLLLTFLGVALRWARTTNWLLWQSRERRRTPSPEDSRMNLEAKHPLLCYSVNSRSTVHREGNNKSVM